MHSLSGVQEASKALIKLFHIVRKFFKYGEGLLVKYILAGYAAGKIVAKNKNMSKIASIFLFIFYFSFLDIFKPTAEFAI